MGVYIVVKDGADEALAKRRSVNGEMFVRLGDGRFSESPLGDAVADSEREAGR